MIVIIDYKVGNPGSIYNMLKKTGHKSEITSDRQKIETADKIILPGVGSFDTGMKNLTELGLFELLNFKVLEQKVPVLGICLGMQLMAKSSQEGALSGLSWFDASVNKFVFNDDFRFKVPHMGWNYVNQKKSSPLFVNMFEDPKFYFVHSYYVNPSNQADVLTETTYGFDFCSSLEKENIFGTQFHPEKSHKYGMCLLTNFANI